MKFDERLDKDELRQLLLVLHYDLLDEEQATAVRSAIETDPNVASEWAATLRLVGKIADATTANSRRNTGCLAKQQWQRGTAASCD